VNSAYSLSEVAALGVPVELDDGEICCDKLGCVEWADVLVAGGAALCRGCFSGFRYHDERHGDAYDVDEDQLVGDEQWRAARRAEYEDRLRCCPPSFERRFPCWDERLDQLAVDAVEDLLEDLAIPLA
jgi:hypothetical protein